MFRKSTFIALIILGGLICLYSFLIFFQYNENLIITSDDSLKPCEYFPSDLKSEKLIFKKKYQDLPIFPEIENFNCIGKIIDIDFTNQEMIIGSSSLLSNIFEFFGYIFLFFFSFVKKSKNLIFVFGGFLLIELSKNNIFQYNENWNNIFINITPLFFLCLIVHVFHNYKENYSEIKKDKFRYDINFLRFISVISVVLYHIEIPFFEAGWLGVDIFFVISGYLICNSIVSKLNDKQFKFKDFYLRRINRILPSLYVVLIFSFLLSRVILSDKGIREFNNSFVSVVGFLSNYYFRGNNLYTAEPSGLVPLLHAWSLSIEEQFYFFFPLLIFIVYKLKKELTGHVVTFLIFYSIFLNLGNYEANDIFYITKFRIWELCLGVLLVFINKDRLSLSKHFNYLGYLIIISSILLFNNKVESLLPKIVILLGVSLIILNKEITPNFEKFFSNSYISLIGLSSYSIYLYHQPIFAFYRNLKENYQIKKSLAEFVNFKENLFLDYFFNDSFLPYIFLLTITLIIGIFSYRRIELEFIGSKSFNSKNLILFFLTISIGVFVYFENNNNSTAQKSINNELPMYNDRMPELENLLAQKEINKSIYVVGDSHMDMEKQFNFFRDKGFEIKSFIEGNCFYIKNLYVSDLESNLEPWCKDLHDQTKNSLSNVENSIILYGGILPNYIEKEQFYNGYVFNERRTPKVFIRDDQSEEKNIAQYIEIKNELNLTVAEFAKNGNIIIIIYPVPEAAWNVEKINNLIPNFEEIDLHYSYDYFYSRAKNSINIYDSLTNDNIVKVKPSSLFCNSYIKGRCVISYNGDLFYEDYDHLNSFGNEILVTNMIDNLIYKLKN